MSADIVLVGKEFWDYFFGTDCYNKVIKIFETVTIEDNKEGIQRKSFDEIFKIAYKRISK